MERDNNDHGCSSSEEDEEPAAVAGARLDIQTTHTTQVTVHGHTYSLGDHVLMHSEDQAQVWLARLTDIYVEVAGGQQNVLVSCGWFFNRTEVRKQIGNRRQPYVPIHFHAPQRQTRAHE